MILFIAHLARLAIVHLAARIRGHRAEVRLHQHRIGSVEGKQRGIGWCPGEVAPELRQRLEKGGWRMMSMSVSEAESYARSEADKWTRFLKQAGISGD